MNEDDVTTDILRNMERISQAMQRRSRRTEIVFWIAVVLAGLSFGLAILSFVLCHSLGP